MQFCSTLENRWSRMAGTLDRHGLLPAVVFLCAVGLRLALLPVSSPGVPSIHDEFAYLLQADTFAAGRLTSPTPPGWEHFQTFHTLMTPTYASKYPPGQGAFLALGQLAGHPWLGVLLSMGLFCGAVTWCARAWMRPSLALLAGVLLAMQLAAGHPWSTGYFGGCVAGLGGALCLGAASRLLGSWRWQQAMLCGLGLPILSQTRPLEGCVLGLCLMGWLLWAALRQRIPLRRLLAPTAMLLAWVAALVAWTGFYNHAVTGTPLTMPHSLYAQQYLRSGHFLWAAIDYDKPLPYEMLQRMTTEFWVPRMEARQTLHGFVTGLGDKASNFLAMFVLPGWGIGLLMAVHLRSRLAGGRTVLLGLCGLTLAMNLPVVQFHAHYAAPFVPVWIIAAMLGLRRLRALRRHEGPARWGRLAARTMPLVFVLQGGFSVYEGMAAVQTRFPHTRQAVMATLEAQPGKDLVFVQYGPAHNIHAEWVHNPATFATAPVLMARTFSPEQDAALMAHYPDRIIWRVEPGMVPPRLTRLREPLAP